LRRRGLHRWIVPYALTARRRRAPGADEEVHVLLCIADHYEPFWGKVSPAIASTRVENWVREYPRQFGAFRDSDGRPPRHTFFYPQEEYDASYLDALAELCRAGFGEVEVHLHHHDDTADGLRDKLQAFKEVLAGRHGLLARRRTTGEIMYGFIHGNWGLCNGRPDRRFCGVNDELTVLRETGCYADFTFPSAPHPSQFGKLNSIYYACSSPASPGGHRRGWNIGAGNVPESALLMIQGPLVLQWQKGRRRPRLENGCLQESQPPGMARLDSWLKARVQVPSRPDWFFVKLYAHGAQEDSQRALLGESMVRFHRELAKRAEDNAGFHYHYVTAREVYNLVKAAEAGWKGSVQAALDYELTDGLRNEREAASGEITLRNGPAQAFQERHLRLITEVDASARDIGLREADVPGAG
jgi:hypothetical protein